VIRSLILAITVAVGVLAAAPALATSVVLLDLETHLSESTAVVEAVVETKEMLLDERTQRPVTDVAVRVTEVVHGDAPARLTVRQLKGKVGDVELYFAGAGDFVPGARVLLFLTKAEGRWWLTALAQSLFEVSGEGEDALAVRHLDQLHLFFRDPDLGVFPLEGHEEAPAKLSALKARVRATSKGK